MSYIPTVFVAILSANLPAIEAAVLRAINATQSNAFVPAIELPFLPTNDATVTQTFKTAIIEAV